MARLLGGAPLEQGKQLSLAFGVLPCTAVPLEVKAAAAGSHPNFMKWFLEIDHDLASVRKGQRDHPSRALIVQVHIGGFIDVITCQFDVAQGRFGAVLVFGIGHYNSVMVEWRQILGVAPICEGGRVMRSTVAAVLTGLILGGCGQKGPLYLPGPESAPTKAAQPAPNNLPMSER